MTSSTPRAGERAVVAIPETTLVMSWSMAPARPQKEPGGGGHVDGEGVMAGAGAFADDVEEARRPGRPAKRVSPIR